MASGTTFDIDVDVSADAVEPAAAALAKLAERLTSAGQASSASAQAVQAAEASYRAAEVAADRAARAVEKIGLQATAQRDRMQAAMNAGNERAFWRAAAAAEALATKQRDAAAAAEAAKAHLEGEAAALDSVRAGALAAADGEAKLAKAHELAKKKLDELTKAEAAASAEAEANAKKAAAEAKKKAEAAEAAARGSRKLNETAEAFGALGGPLGALGQRGFAAAEGVKKLVGALGTSMGPYVLVAVAVVALVAAIAAVTAAAIAGVAAITTWAVKLADAARTSRLLADGIAGTVAGGRELDATIQALGARVPYTRDELLGMAGDLAKTGLRGQALSDALEDAAVKAARLKWGPEFEKQTRSLDNQTRRLQSNLDGLFSGLNIEGLLDAFARIVGLFDKTSSSGNAIKVVFESLMQPLVDGLTALGPKIVATFIQFEIWVLRALIAIKPFGSTLLFVAKAVGIVAALIGGALALVVVGIIMPFAALGAVLTAVVAAVMLLFEGLNRLNAVIVANVGPAFAGLRETVASVLEFLAGIDLVQIGRDLIAGLAQGIASGGAAVLASVTDIANGALDAAKKALGIASPSKEMRLVGQFTGQGMALGIEDETPGVASALEQMAAPPEPSAARGGGPSRPTGGASLNLAGATFNFYGVDGAGDAEARFSDVLTRLLEGDVSQLGAGEEPEAA